MNREIEFRGKAENGDWVYGSHHEIDDLHYIIPIDTQAFHEVILETVGQFTGLYDKNNKKIYDGDILERISQDEKCVLTCKWNNDNYGFDFKYIKYPHRMPCSLEYDTLVIGNIYDNKELLGRLNG